MNSTKIKNSFQKSLFSLLKTLPIMMSVMLFIGLFKVFVSFEKINALLTGNTIIDSLYGALSGSVLAGNVVNSYVIGHEMLNSSISLYAITAFLVAWVTVGFVQIPAEIEIFGTKFTVLRNLFSIILSIVISILTVAIVGV